MNLAQSVRAGEPGNEFTRMEETMSKAFEVMTQKVATCTPDTSAVEVATIMRDRDIGNVLVLEDGKLRGIVTDRDLALQALTSGDDGRQMPVRKLMTTKVVTGEAGWSLEKVAEVMARHRIRRLPILQEGQVVGIISLGDLALHEDRRDVVTRSLQAISTQNGVVSARRSRIGALLGLSLAAAATSMLAWFTWTQSGQNVRKQIAKSELYHSAQKVAGSARDSVNTVASSKSMRDLGQRIRVNPLIIGALVPLGVARRSFAAYTRSGMRNFNHLTARLPVIEVRPARRRFLWFG